MLTYQHEYRFNKPRKQSLFRVTTRESKKFNYLMNPTIRSDILGTILESFEIKQELNWYERRKSPPTMESYPGSW